MFERIISGYKDLEVRVSDHATDEMIYLLNNTIQGSEGGMRYALQDVKPRIEAYGDRIRFVSLYKKNQVTGTIGSCFRVSGQRKLRYPSSYLRYLSIQSVYRLAAGWRRRRKERTRPDQDDSFKRRVLDIFSRPHLLELNDVKEGEKHIMYAFIESMNERSKNLVNQAGYEYVRSFLTVVFSRFSPKYDLRVSRLKEEEKKAMEGMLVDYYRDYSLFTPDYIFYGDKYYVLREGDEIIAGVSAIPGVHRIYNVPGIWGLVMMKLLPRIPYFRKLFTPGEFRYLVFDAIYCRKGEEKKLATLFESVCASEGYYTGLTWLDDRSWLYDKLRTGVKMGALNRMLNAKPGLVFIRFINFGEKEKEPFFEAPAYISGFDFS
ncbi:MAG TPA: hypothetical protein VMT63_08480 [Bacteroidales bacterium]|nr:hypothetical protein [Bacteroidales bacterium]